MSEKDTKRMTGSDKIDSPDKLNDYMRVLSPSVWLVLIATILLLAGALIWAVFGTVQMHNSEGVLETVAPITFVTD